MSEPQQTSDKDKGSKPNRYDLPPDWHKHLNVGMGKVMTEAEFQKMCRDTGKNPTVIDQSQLKQ